MEDCKTNCGKKDISPDEKFTIKCKAFLSLFYMTLQAISSQFINVIAKEIFYISICQLSLIRFIGLFTFSLPIAIICSEHILGEKNTRFLISIRSFLLASSMCLHVGATRYLDLLELSTVRSITPFLTAIIARITLKESIGRVQIFTLIITVCGVLLTLRLPEKLGSNTRTNFDINFGIGLIIALGSMLCQSSSIVATRKLKNVHFSIMGLYTGFIGIIENSILNATLYPLVSINCGWDQLLCILIGILSMTGDIFRILALQVESAGIVAMEKSCLDVLVSAILGTLFLAEYLDLYVILGALLVIASLSIIGMRNYILSMPDSSKTRQKFKWILM